MKCPYCAEKIQPDAQKCRFCGEWLEENQSRQPTKKALTPGSILGIALFWGFLGCLAVISYQAWQKTVADKQAAVDQIHNTLNEELDKTQRNLDNENNRDIEVSYLLVGGDDHRYSLTYTNSQGGTEQKEVFGSWVKTFTVKRGANLYVSAQNKEDYGSVFLSIEVDGKRVRKSESKGAYTIATCDYSLPRL